MMPAKTTQTIEKHVTSYISKNIFFFYNGRTRSENFFRIVLGIFVFLSNRRIMIFNLFIMAQYHVGCV